MPAPYGRAWGGGSGGGREQRKPPSACNGRRHRWHSWHPRQRGICNCRIERFETAFLKGWVTWGYRSIHDVECTTRLRARDRNHLVQNHGNLIILFFLRVVLRQRHTCLSSPIVSLEFGRISKARTGRFDHPDDVDLGRTCRSRRPECVAKLLKIRLADLCRLQRRVGHVNNPRGGVRGVVPAKQAYGT